MNDSPLLTIGVLSWNRLHYLRATLESAKRCIQYPNIQWIVVDNMSTEPGLADYLKSLTWVDEVIFLKSDHVTAMNTIISHARGEVLLMWPDDIQFVVEGNWMADCIEILLQNKWIGSLCLSFQRRETLQRHWGAKRWLRIREMLSELKWFGRSYRFQRKLHSARGFPIYTYGWAEAGIAGAGIASLTRTEVWKTLGPWKSKIGGEKLIDSSGGGETEMLARWRRSKWPLQRALLTLPVSADIITDPTGTKAKVRGDMRYGVYNPPPEGTFYYQIFSQKEAESQNDNRRPIPFEVFVKPIGYELPLDQKGDLLKSGINLTIAAPLEE